MRPSSARLDVDRGNDVDGSGLGERPMRLFDLVFVGHSASATALVTAPRPAERPTGVSRNQGRKQVIVRTIEGEAPAGGTASMPDWVS